MKLRKIIDKGGPNNKKVAYDFFVNEKGYSPKIALGIIGNLMQESRTTLDTSALGFDGTGSFGIAQWLGPRKKKLKEIRPDDWNTLTGQLEFIDWELNNTEKRAGVKLKEASTVEDAALIFSKYYERPHKDYAHNDKRISYAKNLGKELGVDFNNKSTTNKEIAKVKQNNTVKIDNTRVKKSLPPKLATAPINPTYTMLPQDEKKEEKTVSSGINEAQLREILAAERKNTENRFMEAFKNQSQPIQEPSPQYQPEDISHLYNYINIDNYSDGGSYTVKKGDSLSKIARDNNLTLSEIIELNTAYKENPDLLRVGDTLNLGITQQNNIGASSAGSFGSLASKRNRTTIDPAYLDKLKQRSNRSPYPKQVVKESTNVKSPIVNRDVKINKDKTNTGLDFDNLSTPEDIKRVQKILYYSGYDLGSDKNKAIDGKMGPRTRKALDQYKNKLSEKNKPKKKDLVDRVGNAVPLSVRQYVYDTFGGEGEVNETDLSDRDLSALRNVVVKNINRDKFKVDYDDWREARGSDKDTREDDMNLLDPFSNLQKTLGQASIKIDETGDIYVNDRYNFNDAGKKENRYKNKYTTEDGLLPVSKDNSVSNNIYRIARNYKTKYGKSEGGSPVKIYIGNVSEIF